MAVPRTKAQLEKEVSRLQDTLDGVLDCLTEAGLIDEDDGDGDEGAEEK